MGTDQNTAKNEAQVKECDFRIAQLKRELDRYLALQRDIKKELQENEEYYNKAVKSKRALENTMSDIVSYARRQKSQVDDKVKIIKEMYAYVESSVRQSKMSNQSANINDVVKSSSVSSRKANDQLASLNKKIAQLEAEIDALRRKRSGIING